MSASKEITEKEGGHPFKKHLSYQRRSKALAKIINPRVLVGTVTLASGKSIKRKGAHTRCSINISYVCICKPCLLACCSCIHPQIRSTGRAVSFDLLQDPHTGFAQDMYQQTEAQLEMDPMTAISSSPVLPLTLEKRTRQGFIAHETGKSCC